MYSYFIFRETHHRVAMAPTDDHQRRRHHSGYVRGERSGERYPPNPARSLSPSSDLISNPEQHPAASQPSSIELQKLYVSLKRRITKPFLFSR